MTTQAHAKSAAGLAASLLLLLVFNSGICGAERSGSSRVLLQGPCPCVLGSFCNSTTTSCQPCRAGTFRNVTSVTTCRACGCAARECRISSCDAATGVCSWTLAPPTTACGGGTCDANGACTACPVGQVKQLDGTCSGCIAANTWSPGGATATCRACSSSCSRPPQCMRVASTTRVCDTTTGQCLWDMAENGATCTSGRCLGGVCLPAAPGTFWLPLPADPPAVVCDEGRYCPPGGPPGGYECGPLQVCPPNSVAPTPCAGPTCVWDPPCPAASYCPVRPTTTTPAQPCPAGYYCPANSVAPIPCPVGKFCPANSDQPSTACTLSSYCPPAVRAPPPMAPPQPNIQVLPCPPGTFCPGGSTPIPRACPATCAPRECRVNDGCDVLTGTCRYKPAEAGTFCGGGGYCSAADEPSCIWCPAGNICSRTATAPTPCEGGTFCPSGATAPTPCPAGRYCTPSSSTTTVCPAGSFCPAGSASPGACPPGFYCPLGAPEALPCPAGSYCPANATSPVTCPVGSYCPAKSVEPAICPTTSFCPDVAVPPVACRCTSPPPCQAALATGSRCDTAGGACLWQPVANGATCTNGLCLDGTCIGCLPGFIFNSSATPPGCTPCPPGTTSAGGSATACTTSRSCDASVLGECRVPQGTTLGGYCQWTPAAPNAACSLGACDGAGLCLPCPPGTFRSASGCSPCTSNTWSLGGSTTACTACSTACTRPNECQRVPAGGAACNTTTGACVWDTALPGATPCVGGGMCTGGVCVGATIITNNVTNITTDVVP